MRSHPHSSSAAPMSVGFLLAALLAPASPADAADTKAFTFTSDFATGTLSVVDLASGGVACDVETVHSDAVLRWYGGLLYVVNRFGGDNIQVVSPALGYATVRQFSTGNGSNPQDIAFLSPTKAYVSRYGSASLLIVNPSDPNGLPQSSISLAGFADSDGIPEMARMIRIGRYLFVACQRLTSFTPSNPSLIVVVDTQTDQVVDVDPVALGVQGITLVARNPVTAFVYDRTHARLLIGCAGAFGTLDGGVEAIDPFTFMTLGLVATEQTLGGDIADVEWYRPDRSFALVSTGSQSKLLSWNPETGAVWLTLDSANGGFSLPDMELNSLGELYVCRNPSPPSSADPPALWVWRAELNTLIDTRPTCLPPIGVTFDHATDEVTSVPADTPVALRLLGPWPNPTRGPARVALRLERETAVEVAVLDAAGRRVRGLASGSRRAGEHVFLWDLSDQQGRGVSAGLYFLQARAGAAVTVRKLAVLR